MSGGGQIQSLLATGKSFVDTNIIVYANDRADSAKQELSLAVTAELIRSGRGVISTQVLMEYSAVAIRKLGQSRAAITRQTIVLERLEVVGVTAELIRTGHQLAEEHSLSFWDGVIVAVAAAARCDRILSEDFDPARLYAGMAVVNPYRQA
ncbi:MAG TPA: PIN domain-containing protein [Alkalispirochaeta sp.]|nr:PIN domain-containing protein [Alkalispirochaeta sp.]